MWFKPGDRVVTNSRGTIRDDARFGAYQNCALTTQKLHDSEIDGESKLQHNTSSTRTCLLT